MKFMRDNRRYKFDVMGSWVAKIFIYAEVCSDTKVFLMIHPRTFSHPHPETSHSLNISSYSLYVLFLSMRCVVFFFRAAYTEGTHRGSIKAAERMRKGLNSVSLSTWLDVLVAVFPRRFQFIKFCCSWH